MTNVWEEDDDSFLPLDTPGNDSGNAQLARITALAERMEEQEALVERIEASLEEAKKKLVEIQQFELPSLMREANLMEFKLANGTKVELKEDLQTSTSAERMPLIVRWLQDNNFDGIVKTAVKMEFGRGEAELARETAERLRSMENRAVELQQTIHPQTLKAFVKERMADATEGAPKPPTDLFAIRPFDKVTLKQSKKR